LWLGVAVREAETSAHDTIVHHGDNLVSSTQQGTRFIERGNIERKRAMLEAAQSEGSGVGKVRDANMG
jgi:hypothetical protein